MAAERKGGIGVGTIICAFAAYAAFKMYSNSWIWDDVHQWLRSPSITALSKPPPSASKPKPPPDKAPPREVAPADDTLTLDNFEAQFTRRMPTTGLYFGRFECGPDAFNTGGTFCINNVQLGKDGANLIIKSGATSRRLTYAGLMIANPELMQEPARSELVSFYKLLTARLVSVVDPELRPEAGTELLTKLQAGVGPRHREASVVVGQWVYEASSGVLDWGFSAKRK